MLLLKCGLAALTLCLAAFPDSIDDYVKAEMQRQHIPGLALGIYERGQVIRAQGYGLANVELEAPVKPDTIFQSGSVGKQFLATAIMMLVEEGKLDLDKSITAYLQNAPQTWTPIKISNLLSHTSGLGEYENDARTKPGGPFWLRLDYTEDQLFAKICEMPLDFQPGEKWRYTNTNYVVLGVLVHKITGKFYGDFLTERIFQPLGMTSTRIISEADIIHGRASGYRLVKGELKNQEWVSPTFNSTGDGALYFNVPDLAKWDGALYTEKLIHKASLDRMWTVVPLNDGQPNSGKYGFAWSVDHVKGHRVVEHGGAWQGFTTFIARYLDDGITVVVLTNLDSAHSNPGKIAHSVAGLYRQELNAGLIPVRSCDTEAGDCMIQIGAPSATIDTPIEHLMACHRRIEQRLDTLVNAAAYLGQDPASARPAVEKSFHFLETSGAMHTADEEESLFPRLRPLLSTDEIAFLNTLEAEHRQAAAIYQELKKVSAEIFEASAPDSLRRYRECAGRLRFVYRKHIQAEDEILTALAKRSLATSDIEQISKEMRARRS